MILSKSKIHDNDMSFTNMVSYWYSNLFNIVESCSYTRAQYENWLVLFSNYQIFIFTSTSREVVVTSVMTLRFIDHHYELRARKAYVCSGASRFLCRMLPLLLHAQMDGQRVLTRFVAEMSVAFALFLLVAVNKSPL